MMKRVEELKGQNKMKFEEIVDNVFTKFLSQAGYPTHSKYPHASELLKILYNSENRYYHTSEHIEYIFNEIKKHKLNLNISVELALLYHDVVYVPNSKNNETLSADFMENHLKSMFPVTSSILQSKHFIEQTANHFKDDFRILSSIIMDLDISSFATDDYDYFCKLRKDIIKEFDTTPEKDIAFLEMVLNRESIYLSEHGKEHYEEKARRNIERYIKENKKLFITASEKRKQQIKYLKECKNEELLNFKNQIQKQIKLVKIGFELKFRIIYHVYSVNSNCDCYLYYHSYEKDRFDIEKYLSEFLLSYGYECTFDFDDKSEVLYLIVKW